jgi:hypothetical protein
MSRRQYGKKEMNDRGTAILTTYTGALVPLRKRTKAKRVFMKVLAVKACEVSLCCARAHRCTLQQGRSTLEELSA